MTSFGISPPKVVISVLRLFNGTCVGAPLSGGQSTELNFRSWPGSGRLANMRQTYRGNGARSDQLSAERTTRAEFSDAQEVSEPNGEAEWVGYSLKSTH